MQLTLYHFFPNHLSLYGDRGNVFALKKRCEWRNINLEIIKVDTINKLNLSDADILYIGGGSNREQKIAATELVKGKNEIKAAIEDGVSCLAICAGYQLMGSYYETSEGESIKGINLLDFYTKGEKVRLVQNIVISSNNELIFGFENHSGRTYHNYEPFGQVIRGFGNNGKDKTEGIRYKNLIGTYLHGPLLPKNPFIADEIISKALERRYSTRGVMDNLNDSLELMAREKLLNQLNTANIS